MYRIIWDKINKIKNISRKQKHRIFISANVVLYGFIGITMWYLFGLKEFNGDFGWFICFVGYPSVLLGFAGSIFALFKLDQ
ncbi:MAG: hypothetical protein IJI66_07190 [Erysipelotrichaceae bacterium]|nr:hypothetical protein [Erysipelotrichaceae bacterium]